MWLCNLKFVSYVEHSFAEPCASECAAEPCRAHPDVKHTSHVDDATVLRDAAKDAAQFNCTPPAIGSPSTEVLRGDAAQ
jgi:hypothetical protein